MGRRELPQGLVNARRRPGDLRVVVLVVEEGGGVVHRAYGSGHPCGVERAYIRALCLLRHGGRGGTEQKG